MSAARLFVRAVVVTDGRTRHLPAVIHALDEQNIAPDVLHIVRIAGAELPELPARLRALVSTSDATTYAGAVDEVLAEHRALPHEYLWLLHDDTAPLPDALAKLSATARKRGRAGVIGAAHVRWDDSHRLVNLGTTVSRVGARRVTLVEEDDVNQGQYHERDDVLAVSLGAALARRDVWERLRGLDPAYGGFGDSIDFCRRTWRAGHDVVIVPAARVRHAQDTLYGRRGGSQRGRRATYVRRRTSEWYHALAWSPLWAVPLLLAWAWVSAPLRAIGRIAQNESRMAFSDLAVPWHVIGRLPRLARSRASIRRTSSVPAKDIRPLLASLRTIIDHVRARELGAFEQRRAQAMPSDVVRAELAAAARKRRQALGVVALVATALSSVVFARWLPGLAAGKMPSSPILGATDLSTGQLWTRTWTGWSEAGFGVPALDGTFAALMLPFSLMTGGLPLGIGLLLMFGVVWATLTAWAAVGAATRSVWARAVIALAYGLWPMFLQSVAEGRVGAVIAHIVLPLFFLGIVRAVGWHRGESIGGGEEFPARRNASPSAAFGAALALATVSAATPVMVVPLVLVVVVVGAVAGRARWRVWGTVAPALVLAGPAVTAWLALGTGSRESWWVLARENGPAMSPGVLEAWHLAFGLGVSDPLARGDLMSYVAFALGGLVALAAFTCLALGRAVGAVAAGWVIAALGWVTAVMSASMVVVWADAAGASAAHGWPGAGSSLMAVGLLGAVAAATHGMVTTGDASASRVLARVSAVGAVVVTMLVLVVHAGATVWAEASRHDRVEVAMVDREVLPLVASLEQQVRTGQRVLVVNYDDDGGVWFSVLSRDGSDTLTGRAHVNADGVPLARIDDTARTADVAVLSPVVAALVTSGEGVSEDLAAWGIGVVVAPPGAPVIAGALDQIPELTLMGASDLGTSWRVSRPGLDEPVSRAWFVSSDGTEIALPMAGGRIDQRVTASQPGAVVLAVAADPNWVATFDGEPLTRVSDERGRTVFALPAGSGHLEVGYRDPTYRMWWWLGAIAVVWALVGAIPVHGQRDREEAS